MSETINGGIVRHTPDPANPPRLNAEQEQRLATMRDEDIDLSDIPDQSGRPGWYPYGGVAMRRAALRDGLLPLDPEVVEFFKATGEAPAESMQAILREYVEAHRKSA